MVKERFDEELASAGWEPNGTFSEHLAIGTAGDFCIIVPAWVWDKSTPVFELYDLKFSLSHWVTEIPTPQEAAAILRWYGRPPEEERGNPYRTTG